MSGIDPAEWGTRRRRRFSPEKWAPLICQSMWDEVPGVRTFHLCPADGSRIEHAAGQFLTFEIETPQGRVERCYTISSSAARDGGVEITVKRQPGHASAQLHDTLVPGAQINAFGPSGRFGPALFPTDRFALLAAGSGITPMLSILRTAADRGLPLDAVLVQVAPTESDIIAADDLRLLGRRLPGLVYVPVTTREAGGTRPTADTLSALIPDLIGPVVRDFLAGDKDAATRGYARILPAINHENRQCGFRAAKAAMVAGGVIASDFCRHPIAPLHPATRAMLLDLLTPLDPLVLRWGR